MRNKNQNVYTVGQVNSYIKNIFDQDYMLRRIYVSGEVSNCKYHPSGHIYFSLKDAERPFSLKGESLFLQNSRSRRDVCCKATTDLSLFEVKICFVGIPKTVFVRAVSGKFLCKLSARYGQPFIRLFDRRWK